MLDALRRWRATKRQECLLIKGARQVGKSFIVEQFGKEDYRHFVKVDFVLQPAAKEVFEGDLSADRIFRGISLLAPDARFERGETLLFLDEIQECPKARTALKYLALDGRVDVVASGSLLGIAYREETTSIPVGYERQVVMHPLDFEEFLWARGFGEDAVGLLRDHLANEEPLPPAMHDRMMGYLREYLAVGGMPDVVSEFVEADSYGAVHDRQRAILATYEDDIARYATAPERVKARACYQSLPRQLAKENTKFQYSVVESRGTARKFGSSVDWLEGARMALRCRMVSTPRFPLVAYEKDDRFRLYANDTGLLLGMHDFSMKAAVVGDSLKGPMKGGLYENLVACMLEASGIPLRYWRSDDGSREIEFLVDIDAHAAPIEVKAKRGSTTSLNAILADPDVMAGYKIGAGNVGRDGKKLTLPLYLAPFLFESLAGVRG